MVWIREGMWDCAGGAQVGCAGVWCMLIREHGGEREVPCWIGAGIQECSRNQEGKPEDVQMVIVAQTQRGWGGCRCAGDLN